MKRVLTLLIICNVSLVFAENTIIAIVNNSLITYNSLAIPLLNINSKERKIDIINQRVNVILQLEKATELDIKASPNEVNLALIEVSKSNNISLASSLSRIFILREGSCRKDFNSQLTKVYNKKRHY